MGGVGIFTNKRFDSLFFVKTEIRMKKFMILMLGLVGIVYNDQKEKLNYRGEKK